MAHDPDMIAVDPDILMGDADLSKLTSQEQTVSVITVNGKKFVSELFWQPLRNPRGYMGEARHIGKKNNWDVVAIRKAPLRIQAGFISKSVGATKGMYSLASSLGGVLGDQWLGAFEVAGNRYAVVAIDKGSVIPGFDRIVGREEALSLLQQGVNLGNFNDNQIFAPADFSFATKSHELAQLLTTKNLKARYRLKQLTFGLTVREIVMLAMLVVLLVGGLYAYSEWVTHQERKALQAKIIEQKRREQELAALNARTLQEQGMKALEHPWAKMAATTEVIATCVDAQDLLPLSVGGWMFESFVCGSGGLTATYARTDFSTLQSFYDTANTVLEDMTVAQANSDSIAVTKPWETSLSGDTPIDTLESTTTELTTRFQSLGIKLSFEDLPYELPKVPEPAPGEPLVPVPVPTWKQVAFKYDEAGSNPTRYFKGIERINGIRVTEIKAVFKPEIPALSWSVKGEIYAK